MDVQQLMKNLGSTTITEEVLGSLQDTIEDLSPEGREVLRRIVETTGLQGSPYYRKLLAVDYEEEPVDILTFITDGMYLGKVLRGGTAVYPYWKQMHQELQESGSIVAVFTGPIGGGKSFNARIAVAYQHYRVLCLRDPYTYYDLVRTEPIALLFFNLTQSLSSSGTFNAYQRLIRSSPWFQARGVLNTRYKEHRLEFPGKLDYAIGTPKMEGFGFVGLNIIGGVMDEISEIRNAQTMEAKILAQQRAYEMFLAAIRRMESRFKKRAGLPPGRLFLISSKQDESAFLEQYVEQEKRFHQIFVKDDPIWVMMPPGTYARTTFPVAIGDRFRASKMIAVDEVEQYEVQGYQIINPPVGEVGHMNIREAFERDVDGSLREIAGISITSSRTAKLIPRREFIQECANKNFKNPFTEDIVFLGLKATAGLEDYYIRPEKVTPTERYIHVDLAKSRDALGMAMCHVSGTKTLERTGAQGVGQVTDDTVQVDFIIRVKNMEGDEIPFYRVRQFIHFLAKQVGYQIKLITFDGWQSSDMIQLLTRAGFESEEFSVDRDDAAYLRLRSAIYEQRIEYPFYEIMMAELADLEHDTERKKVDHPANKSKDTADALAGCVANALELSANITPVDTISALKELDTQERMEDRRKKFWFVEDHMYDEEYIREYKQREEELLKRKHEQEERERKK